MKLRSWRHLKRFCVSTKFIAYIALFYPDAVVEETKNQEINMVLGTTYESMCTAEGGEQKDNTYINTQNSLVPNIDNPVQIFKPGKSNNNICF